MKSTFKYLFLLFCISCIGLTSCREGWDDDSEFDISTRASFFLTTDGNGLRIVRLVNGGLEADWNTKFGISNANLSDMDLRDNYVWLASGAQRSILQINPETEAVEETFGNLPIAPHFIAVGEEQVIAADTAANRLIFVKKKNGKVVEVNFDQHPGPVLYNNQRFFLVVDTHFVSIYDEKALTPRAVLDCERTIREIHFSEFNNLEVITSDTSGSFQAVIAGTADIFAKAPFAVSYQKIRFTPYFTQRFGNEFLEDLRLVNGELQLPLLDVLYSPLEDFETNFFSGRAYLQRSDTLLVFNLHNQVVEDTLNFPYAMVRVYHQIGGVE